MEQIFAHAAQKNIVDNESVELVPVYCEVAYSGKFPNVLLVNGNSNQMRHDVRKAVIMVSFDPDNLNFSLWIREFADVAQELPMFFREAPKVQVGKDVSQQDQAIEPKRLKKTKSFFCPANLASEVQVRQDECVKMATRHAP